MKVLRAWGEPPNIAIRAACLLLEPTPTGSGGPAHPMERPRGRLAPKGELSPFFFIGKIDVPSNARDNPCHSSSEKAVIEFFHAAFRNDFLKKIHTPYRVYNFRSDIPTLKVVPVQDLCKIQSLGYVA
uniref:Uncharacterized protein n=1 Tax=Coccidioides posadasii RMSCC 3488 TaxID=454284 RepID=A0A0J6F561_COCPO|nr:hypothetical protein CPAG_04378 [Coccidioides posadasii RMSCC 3488]